jgi:hypothetical protein
MLAFMINLHIILCEYTTFPLGFDSLTVNPMDIPF